MKTKVFNRLEPKAKSYGFSKEELMTVCESIANGFSSEDEATDEAIDARIDAALPFLRISQSAANRSYERMKAKFEEENKKNNPPKVDEPADDDKNKDGGMPDWFKSFKEQYEADQKTTNDKFNAMKQEKANEGFLASVKASLKDVDQKFYSRDLSGRTFESQEEADSYVSSVIEDWNSFCSERNIKAMKDVTPPGSNDKPTKPNENVMNRVNERSKEEPKSVIKGL